MENLDFYAKPGDRAEYWVYGKIEFGTVVKVEGKNIGVKADGSIHTTWVTEKDIIEVTAAEKMIGVE